MWRELLYGRPRFNEGGPALLPQINLIGELPVALHQFLEWLGTRANFSALRQYFSGIKSDFLSQTLPGRRFPRNS
jgi:hypothetical protein